MALRRISDLSDDLLIKILSFLPTKVAVSTSILSKQWQFLWMWLPKLDYDDSDIAAGPLSSWLRYERFIDKNLPLHRAPVIETLLLSFVRNRLSQPEKIKQWVEIAVSRFVRELSVGYFNSNEEFFLSLPSRLYEVNSLVALKLEGKSILVDVSPPRTVYLPRLKTLQLQCVTYANEASLPLLLSHCPVLEDLLVERDDEDDNAGLVVVNVASLQRLSLEIDGDCSSDDEYVIVTPCLKYLKIEDHRGISSYLIEPMPKAMMEEADIRVFQVSEKLLKSVASVKRLSLSLEESVYPSVGIVLSQLEHLKLRVYKNDWSKLLIWLLRNYPKLRVLNLYVVFYRQREEYEPVDLKDEESSVPGCLLTSLETFEFSSYMGTQEERDFLSFFFKHASCLKSTSVIHRAPRRDLRRLYISES